MSKRYVPKAIRELRKIRDEIHKEAMAVGFDRYYDELNKKAGWLLGSGKKARRGSVVRERPAKYKTRKAIEKSKE
jgi:hypothetical protein